MATTASKSPASCWLRPSVSGLTPNPAVRFLKLANEMGFDNPIPALFSGLSLAARWLRRLAAVSLVKIRGETPNTVSLENFNCRLAVFFCGPYLGSPDRELGTRLALDRAGIAFAPATSSSGLAKMIAHFPEDDLPFFRGKMTGRGLLGWIL